MKQQIPLEDLLVLLDALAFLDYDKLPMELAQKLDKVRYNLVTK